MTLRETFEQREHAYLSPCAAFADRTQGRARPEPESDLRTCYMRDRDRVIHSKSFRRLKHKTQVFLSPEGDHYRTRLTHTLEVAQISRTVARGLGLNEDLTEAIALAHDLGHTPFGHAGEKALRAVAPCGFSHNEQSLRVVRFLEKDGAGLNLTHEVCDGVLCHTGEKKADTLEGRVVHYADRIAYINHDIDDSIRAGILTADDLPREVCSHLGETHSARIDHLVHALVEYGQKTGQVGLSREDERAVDELRAFMFDAVYRNPAAKGEEYKGMDILRSLYEHYAERPDELPEETRLVALRDGLDRAVCDYIAGMTDRYAVARYLDIFIPKNWNKY
ncbi:MAG: deoxyguanosinetriphosphate triphosphohydrolase [Clostridia bacterium]|nr:deoxyguanosinetriphosphate triphosphohydrolase [Clostridia bacterium]